MNTKLSEPQATPNISINYYGYLTPFGGYGISNFNWIKHLQRQGVKVYPHGKFTPQKGTKEWDILDEEERTIASIPFRKERIGLIETTPFDFGLNESEIKVGMTMAENNKIGGVWVDACNGMDYLVLPNDFQKKVFESSGVTTPIKVIRFGTETEKFPYFERKTPDIFTFGIVGYLDKRKGVFDVLRAFASEFDRSEPVRLVMKSSNPDFGFYSQFDHNIITINKLYDFKQLNELYQSFDCFVFPSKAEGVGQPPREAMATGLPCILGNYSGLEEICNPEYTYPINPNGFSPRDGWIEQPGDWADYDIQELMYWMRYVYEHQEAAKEKGKKAASWIREEHSWEKAAREMILFLTEINATHPKEI